MDIMFKNLINSNSISKEIHKTIKPVGTRRVLRMDFGKTANVNKQQIDGCTPYWPILSALLTPTYNLAKFLVPILKFFNQR